MRFKRVYIEITNICNLSCSFCSQTGRESRTMSVDEFEHIAKQVREFTEYIYLHVKGEPLLHPELEKILDTCSRYGLKVNLTTNGTLLKKQLAVLTTHSAIRQINVSLHSLTQQDSKIDDFMKTVTDLICTPNHPLIQLRLWTLATGNSEKVKDIISFLTTELELDFDVVYKSVKAGDYYTLKPKVFLDYDKEFTWPSLENEYISDRGICYGLRSMISILCDGTVVPCCLDACGVINLGNVFSEQLGVILSSKLVEDFTHNIKNRKLTQELCKRCSYRLIFERGMKHEQSV